MSLLAATGAGDVLAAIDKKGFSYRPYFTRTSGTLEYDLGRTAQGNPLFMFFGTWSGTVIIQFAKGRGGSTSTWEAVPGESYTAVDAIVLE